MNFVENLAARNLIQDISDRKALEELKPGTPFYAGFDPTAPSLQVGNLIPLMVSFHLAQAGFKPIILFGGATGSIGDPSGKSEERKLLDRVEIDKNVQKQISQVEALSQRAGITCEFVNNLDWTQGLSVLDFLRDTGKHFTVNYMIAKEVIKNRLGGDGISFTEFSYMLLQAYDFFHLYQTKSCRLQVGGSDQWGNITAGLELIRKKVQGEAVAFSIPLLTDSQGKKFGKSEGGAVWLDPQLTSPYQFHQFWLNCPDTEAIKCLLALTFLGLDEIKALQAELSKSPEKRTAQSALADTLCDFVHGADATRVAKNSAEVLFGGSCQNLSAKELEQIFSDVPSNSFSREALNAMSVSDLLAQSGAVKSKGEARRLISNGGAYLNNERIGDPQQPLSESIVADKEIFIVRTGKKNYRLIRTNG